MSSFIQSGRFGGGGSSLISIITSLGLTSGLKVCLDAGDINSYNGTSQTWTDTSGEGNSYFRGTTSGAQGSDPTFVGTPGGLSSNDYFSFDGNDQFAETTNQTWADGFGLDGALFSMLAVVWIPDSLSGFHGIFSNGLPFNSGSAMNFYYEDDDKLHYADSPFSVFPESSNFRSSNSWNFCGLSVSENAGATGSFLQLQTTVTTFNGNQTVDASVSGAYTVGFQMRNTSRLTMFAAWAGVALTTTQMDALYDQIQSKRHPTLP